MALVKAATVGQKSSEFLPVTFPHLAIQGLGQGRSFSAFFGVQRQQLTMQGVMPRSFMKFNLLDLPTFSFKSRTWVDEVATDVSCLEASTAASSSVISETNH